jgi:hypothetical protein
VNRFAGSVLLFILAACSGHESTGPTGTSPATANVVFAGGTVAAEIAATAGAQETGLMNRSTLGADSGMLFVFATDQDPLLVAFWMKGTSIPLSIAFMDATHRVLSIQDMAPFDTVNFHRPASLYRYALEVNQGWFTSHNVATGANAAFTLP